MIDISHFEIVHGDIRSSIAPSHRDACYDKIAGGYDLLLRKIAVKNSKI
jgi:hypothetical protein